MKGSGQETRAQIVAAAMRLFRTKGFQATTTQEIIREAGCSRGGFYHHFPRKEHLLYLAHETFIDYELTCARRVAAGPGSPGEKLAVIIADLIESIARFQPQVTVFFQERHMLSPENLSQVLQKRDAYVAVVQGVVQEGMACGQFRSDLEPALVTLALFGMCNWTYQWYRSDGPLTPGEIAERFVTLFMDGLRKRPGGERMADGPHRAAGAAG